MRKLKLQVQISVDGFVAGPNGEMDWMTWNMDEKLMQYINDLTDSTDTILLGRKMAGGFIDYWANAAYNPADPKLAFGKKMIERHKVIFTSTLEKSEWDNTVLAKGDLASEVNKLKQQDGKDIVVYGGAGFVSSLIKAGLIDEFHLFVNPAAIGKGMSIFGALETTQKLSLVKATPFECGIVVLCYKPAL
jgi:dihydrofolate reductase